MANLLEDVLCARFISYPHKALIITLCRWVNEASWQEKIRVLKLNIINVRKERDATGRNLVKTQNKIGKQEKRCQDERL